MKKVLYIWLVRFFAAWWGKKEPTLVVYLMSFGNNNEFIVKLGQKCSREGKQLVVLFYPSCSGAANDLAAAGIKTVSFTEGLHFLFSGLRFVVAAKLLFCDNYYAFLAGCQFKRQKTRVVQVWHANGAVKSFGWQEPKTQLRSAAAQKRFQAVYDQFDDYVIASPKMGEIFSESYDVDKKKMLTLGYPRSDKFLRAEWITQKRRRFYQVNPALKGKEVILYAPTYRESTTGVTLELPEDFFQLVGRLASNQVLIIKLHPHLKNISQLIRTRLAKSKQVLWMDDFTTEDLLPVTDRLITDYSSVAFDYTLLDNAQEILFYCYDLHEYQNQVGLQHDFEQWLPGPLVLTTAELAQTLKKPLLRQDFRQFNQLWNTRNDGQATARIIKHYFG
ncbi:CDP-glycerol glycerophosphotransferase family protein [Liquorilactobacillus capillatus]|uniref:Teichoic acid biosynthesis protein n=1 Tax=Liquorilactobacillus capillatus DSM 19910 TaxID=1423731 RepID=A0A0R1LZZ0_9LACO|nr:CDP-glycerol glycerophosphotransferase family protein [Liquorilactobacillus capillatus]KRL01263.1 teichoic acid biosynthesis protein [Liquorilactobacillus capillatus DSM 19910]